VAVDEALKATETKASHSQARMQCVVVEVKLLPS
jgi:hypothetical protein